MTGGLSKSVGTQIEVRQKFPASLSLGVRWTATCHEKQIHSEGSFSQTQTGMQEMEVHNLRGFHAETDSSFPQCD